MCIYIHIIDTKYLKHNSHPIFRWSNSDIFPWFHIPVSCPVFHRLQIRKKIFFNFHHIVCSSREVNLDMFKVFTAHCGFSVASSSPVALHAIIPPSGSFGIGTWMQKSWEQNVEIIDAWMQKSWKKKSSRDSKPSAKSNNCFLFLSTSFAIRVLLGLIHPFFARSFCR